MVRWLKPDQGAARMRLAALAAGNFFPQGQGHHIHRDGHGIRVEIHSPQVARITNFCQVGLLADC